MARITVVVDRIDELVPVSSYAGSRRAISMDCDMTKTQMKEALGEFLEHITDAEWCDWIREFSPEYLKDGE